ncbi:Hsp20/alpha crystallin family protein [Croceicoccus bisphenolivorans]|uniref:Hsp20/alpha crystallin family protein n=1 Tax=Croceicoccus bisphenolivorans TaxID=1783232 RepID=UPI000A55759B|nr:Hsp20/alpha crystallin family protein [Croceicoccus bisphenolivorans]
MISSPGKSQGQDIAPRQEERVDHPVMSLHRDINRLFDDMFRGFSMPSLPSIGRSLGWPRVELSENDREIRVTAELPGMEEKDIEISLDDQQLVIRGEKNSETSDEERGYSERSYGRFQRRIGLPSLIDEDKVEAAFRNGVLTVTVPRTAEAAKGLKMIPINAG